MSLGTLFSSQGSRASFAVTPCEGSYSVRLALPGCSFWSYSTSFPVGVQLVLPAGGAGSCCLAGSYCTGSLRAVQVVLRLTWDRSVRISCAPFAPAVRCGANRSRCLAELDSTRCRAAVQLGSECSRWPLTCDRTSTGLASRSVLRSGHSLHSLAQRCQVESHRRRSEPVSTWSESSSLASLRARLRLSQGLPGPTVQGWTEDARQAREGSSLRL
ncbi:hypothetical protein Joe_81 [Streptomyces phage Joe]|uniref:Uncharacterized protein n=1 Tax=Streptomyces phage Joe TaxID=1913034 RepID=A0A1J0GQE3_9CAUD|nr:hypothetical protein KGG94_gp81 [Streptomyces phage Joe]APC43321.1 hypothetical protein Joe_81 [Streptomyces phage Joe]